MTTKVNKNFNKIKIKGLQIPSFHSYQELASQCLLALYASEWRYFSVLGFVTFFSWQVHAAFLSYGSQSHWISLHSTLSTPNTRRLSLKASYLSNYYLQILLLAESVWKVTSNLDKWEHAFLSNSGLGK